MDLLRFCSVLCLLCLCARLSICALWSPAGKGRTSWLSFVVSNCEFVTFPLVSWVRFGYLIVSTPDLCTLAYSGESEHMHVTCYSHSQRRDIYYVKTQPKIVVKVRKRANISNRYSQAPHLTQDTNRKVTTS